MSRTQLFKSFWVIPALCACVLALAQPKLEFAIKKPKQFEERKLGSEKNADKNFNIVRRFFQNTYTHYNYYFNANNLLKEIVENAKRSGTEDYTELLPYYPWSLEQTSKSNDIDSILYKCTAGILLHDLRNDWIDNMYLVMGKAYYLRKDFDSAAMAFQFLNYAFSAKDKGGYDKPIGSNDDKGSNSFTILSKEKKGYIMSRPPSRNDGFVWQIRNLTDRGNYLDASSLISILRNDPNFPKRLEPDLADVTGYLFYKNKMWDSAAVYLEKSMPLASTPSDKARGWYLAGQLYQLGGNNTLAGEAYKKCLGSATDLIMDVYARLNSIRLRKNDDPNIIDENVKDLKDMARKDKYLEYRDIIYYAAAMAELERNGYEEAAGLLEKSLLANTTNSKQKTLSMLALGNTRFLQKQYGKAGPPYDSLNLALLKPADSAIAAFRKFPCMQIYSAEKLLMLQDSLIALADMPEDQRTAVVKKLSSQLRKKMGIQEETLNTGSQNTSSFINKDESANMFATTGTWYFYDPNIRARGFNNFKDRWGARPNDDNWRRSATLGLVAGKKNDFNSETGDPDGLPTIAAVIEDQYDSTDVSFDNLYSRIPLTAERRQKAEDFAIKALFSKAQALHEKIEDYPEAIKVYEEILRRRDTGKIVQQSLYGLIYCYTKTGDTRNAELARKRLQDKFPGSEELLARTTLNEPDKAADDTYENIYNLFLEGNFKEALKERQKADSMLGKSYWKPQLLYMQSVYYIQQREDSLAIRELTNLSSSFSTHPLSEKAKRMVDVLKRRGEIEAYLTKLEVTRATEDTYAPEVTRPSAAVIPKVNATEKPVIDSSKMKEAQAGLLAQKQAAEKEEKERLEKEKATKELEAKKEAERIEAEKIAAKKAEEERIKAEKELAEKQKAEKAKAEKELADKLAMEKALAEKELAQKMADEKARAEKELAEKQKAEREALLKDAANKAEAEKALAEKQALEKQALEKEMAEKQKAEKLKAEKELAENMAAEKLAAQKALAEKQAAEKAEAERMAKEKEAADKLAAERKRAETEAAEKAALAKIAMVDNVSVGKPITPSPFVFAATDKQIVAIVLEKIDPAYVNEVSYSLSHSSLRNTAGNEVSVFKKKLKDGLWLVELHSEGFTSMQKSYEYIKYLKPVTRDNLVSWLDASKYYFITISEKNLLELEKNTDVQLYRKVLQEAVPGKF